MAPEVVKQAPYTNKADIWSVGCLIVEMLTGEHPWGKLNQMQAMFKVCFCALSFYSCFLVEADLVGLLIDRLVDETSDPT